MFPQPTDVARAAAERFVADALAALSEGEAFCVALSGGNTPKEMYRLLASPEFQREIDWDRVKVFWSDERCVPPDHPSSNYGMAKAALLDAVSIPSANVFRYAADRADLEKAAEEYAQQLRDTLPLDVYGSRASTLFSLAWDLTGTPLRSSRARPCSRNRANSSPRRSCRSSVRAG